MYGKFFLVLFSLLLLILTSLMQDAGSGKFGPSNNVARCADRLHPISTRTSLVHEACEVQSQ